LPLDGVMLKAAVKREQGDGGDRGTNGRDVRWLTEDFIYHMPFLGGAMNRLGAVRACQENAERLLAKESLVAVFPEGVKGIGKLFSERYRLQRFGRGGFIKLCLRTGTPIVPVAVMGAEETNPLLFKIEHLSKALWDSCRHRRSGGSSSASRSICRRTARKRQTTRSSSASSPSVCARPSRACSIGWSVHERACFSADGIG
jgi:1-acyl-sn-glycerol-3-phosphate acyltransferase